MPIRPEMKARYPRNWRRISAHIRHVRARGRCEVCGAVNGQPHPDTGSRVVLTVHHCDHVPENCRASNLLALCQRCHLNADRAHHATTSARSLRQTLEAAGQEALF